MTSRSSAPQLKQFAAFWTLHGQPSPKKPWSAEERIRRAKAAGFDAVGAGPFPGAAELCAKHGVDFVCYIDGGADYVEKLKLVAETKPARVNVQAFNHDTPPREAVKGWTRIAAHAEKLGLEVDLEVHRDTCTETPEKTYEIADLYEKATGRKPRFCFDFSHIAVVKHLNPPFAPRLLVRPDLVRLSRQVHFRPFNGHHAQIPATDGRGRETPQFHDYLEFVDAFLACWLAGAKGGEVLYACPEFGPADRMGYGLPAFANVWKDAILLRGKIEAIWKKNLRKWKAGAR